MQETKNWEPKVGGWARYKPEHWSPDCHCALAGYKGGEVFKLVRQAGAYFLPAQRVKAWSPLFLPFELSPVGAVLREALGE